MYFLHFNTMYKSSQPSHFRYVNFFATFSTDSKSASNSAFFDTHIENIWIKYFEFIFALYANIEAKRAPNGSKNRKTYFINVYQFCIFFPDLG
jgi:hypothetical protein